MAISPVKIVKKNSSVSFYSDGKRLRYRPSLDGVRTKYMTAKAIVKVGREQAESELNFYRYFLKPKDRKYFPTLIRGSKKYGYVMQRRLNLHEPYPMKESHRKLVEKLIARYQLHDDLCADTYRNWCINKDTGMPVIYDIGFCGLTSEKNLRSFY